MFLFDTADKAKSARASYNSITPATDWCDLVTEQSINQ